jgi:hypothetical protein
MTKYFMCEDNDPEPLPDHICRNCGEEIEEDQDGWLCRTCDAAELRVAGRPRAKFNVTYEIVTQESAEHGEADERGYIAENVSFRDAVAELNATRTARVDGQNGIQADCCFPGIPRWVTVTNGMEFETGAYESRTLHIPDHVTPASAMRIARYLGAYTYTMGASNRG